MEMKSGRDPFEMRDGLRVVFPTGNQGQRLCVGETGLMETRDVDGDGERTHGGPGGGRSEWKAGHRLVAVANFGSHGPRVATRESRPTEPRAQPLFHCLDSSVLTA